MTAYMIASLVGLAVVLVGSVPAAIVCWLVPQGNEEE